MATHIDATYANGVFKPDVALKLADQERVRLTIEPIDEWSAEKARAAWELLEARLKSRPLHLGGQRIRRDELYDRG
ncbi:MAG: antitoxin family protein [Gemmataceae bacterium]|nr:antitoxin family protein [Gemmataceae bacterium]